MASRGGGASRVLNRAPASIQITAEQWILEARDRADASQPGPAPQHIADAGEMAAYRLKIRKEFEDKLRMQKAHIGVWLRYAKWEESQQEIERARSLYERALDVDFKVVAIWLRYAEMEMRAKFIARARNVWNRAVTLLPRVDGLWQKYAYMEEMLGNVAGARLVFERWMEWEPDEHGWLAWAKFEQRAGAVDHARGAYERYLAVHPSQTAFIRVAKWEDRCGQAALARRVYERAFDELRPDEVDEGLYLAFAKFEERCGENARAGALYRAGLAALPPAACTTLLKAYVSFEKQFGDVAGVEDVIHGKRRRLYEEAVAANPRNYDAWFDYLRMEVGVVEGEGGGGGGGHRPLHHHQPLCRRAVPGPCRVGARGGGGAPRPRQAAVAAVRVPVDQLRRV